MMLFRSEFTYRGPFEVDGCQSTGMLLRSDSYHHRRIYGIMNTLRVYQTTRVRRRNNTANDNDDKSVSQTVRLLTALANIAWCCVRTRREVYRL